MDPLGETVCGRLVMFEVAMMLLHCEHRGVLDFSVVSTLSTNVHEMRIRVIQ